MTSLADEHRHRASARRSPACAPSATPGPTSAPGSGSPARPPSNAGEATHSAPPRRFPSPPGLHTGPGMGASADDTTITWADFLAAEHQYTATGGCTHPIRLTGRIDAIDLATGELAPVYDTGTRARRRPAHRVRQPPRDRLPSLLGRSTSATPASSSAPGSSGGKDVPETIAEHPCVFATLTAPSFGPVHARRMRGKTVLPCRPRRDATRPPLPAWPRHLLPPPPQPGRSAARPPAVRRLLRLRHRRPVQRARRRPVAAVHHLPAPPPRPPRRAHPRQLRRQLVIRYVKVAEYQARGVVHFHAIIRLDAPGETWQPPAPAFTAAMLCRGHQPGRHRRGHHH